MTIGRPTTYTPELASRICEEISAGATLRTICEPDDMPARSSVFLWLARHKEFSDQYARATEDRTAAMAEEILEISDDSRGDIIKTEDGHEVVNNEVIQRSRLRVDTRKWLMSKMAPKKYGEKITQEMTGKDGLPLNAAPTIIFTGCPPNTPAPEAVDRAADGSE